MTLINFLLVLMALILIVVQRPFNELIGLSRVMAEVAREVIVMVESAKIMLKNSKLRTYLATNSYGYHR